MIEYDTVISPCIAICRLDHNNVCVGCFRTGREIQEWYFLPNEERQRILEAVEQRKKES